MRSSGNVLPRRFDRMKCTWEFCDLFSYFSEPVPSSSVTGIMVPISKSFQD